jgi:hypothetical protein
MGDRSPNAQRLVPCMPPLMEEETKPLSGEDVATSFGGTACENIVKAYFLSKNINVAEPYVDNGVDLLIQKPEGWVRGQVKKVVYQLKLDYTHKKNFGGEIYRSRFYFNFQGGSSSKLRKRRQRTAKEIDYFYHVLMTPYRQLIWETPVNLITLRKDGSFISGKNPVIDRDNWKRMKADIDFSELLVYSKYDPIIFKTFPDFFLKPEQQTLCEFFDYE